MKTVKHQISEAKRAERLRRLAREEHARQIADENEQRFDRLFDVRPAMTSWERYEMGLGISD